LLRVVIDTSSLVSYVLTRGQLMGKVVARWRAGDFTLLSSPATRAELDAVLARPSIQRLSHAPLDELVVGYERFTHHVGGDLSLAGACRDAKDDKFLACAVEGEAHYLVSSDRDLLDMRRYGQVAIVSPGQFLLALELHAAEPQALAERFAPQELAAILSAVPLEPGTESKVTKALERLAAKMT